MKAAGRGFTLIEVLIALAIVATTLGGAIVVVQGAANNRDYLDRRRAAAWVADNVINAYRLEPGNFKIQARTGSSRGNETVLGREFTYRLEVKPMAAKQSSGPGSAPAAGSEYSRVEVTVSDAESGATGLASRSLTLRKLAQSL